MKTIMAKSFIQVHYHNRPGGVNKVIGHYAGVFAEAFAEAFTQATDRTISLSSPTNLVLCKYDENEGGSFCPAQMRDVPECGYHAFTSKDAFLKTREILVRRLMEIIRESNVPKPLCVVGHNLTLGKNCALSSAFTQCARWYEHLTDDVRFFSMIHDFAEEGRIDCLKQICRLQGWGIDIWNDLYPKTRNLQFVTPSKRNWALLKRAGFNVGLLFNPVETKGIMQDWTVREKRTALKKLKRYSKREHGRIDPAIPIFFYPARVTSRKNIIEAILVSNIVCKANLVVGKSGPSCSDRKLFAKIKKLCVKYKAPVVFDCSTAFVRKASENDFPAMAYKIADACISTSIAEGFGYAFYEPWVNDKHVIGRRPMDFSPVSGMKFPGLYTRLPIPASWIAIDDCIRKFFNRMRQYYHITKLRQFSSYPKFKQAFETEFIKKNTLDFACLDEQTQLTVAGKLMESPIMVAEWEKRCGKELNRIRESIKNGLQPDRVLIHSNRESIKRLSGDEFADEFERCYFTKPPKKVPQNRYKEIPHYFSDLSHIRLLMTPE